MHKNPSERIKIPQIKAHPWFALYKVGFSPDDGRESSMTRSGLMSDSMLQDSDDPFDDFLNGRIRSSEVSPNTSGKQSALDTTDEKNPDQQSVHLTLQQTNQHGVKAHSGGMNFKKSGKPLDQGFDSKFRILEAIPEERGVDCSADARTRATPTTSRTRWTHNTNSEPLMAWCR